LVDFLQIVLSKGTVVRRFYPKKFFLGQETGYLSANNIILPNWRIFMTTWLTY